MNKLELPEAKEMFALMENRIKERELVPEEVTTLVSEHIWKKADLGQGSCQIIFEVNGCSNAVLIDTKNNVNPKVFYPINARWITVLADDIRNKGYKVSLQSPRGLEGNTTLTISWVGVKGES
jgi:hypothetical protein